MINLGQLKKIGLSGVVISVFVFYALHEKAESSQAIRSVGVSTNSATSETLNPTNENQNSQMMGGNSASGMGMMNKYRDGQYVSSVADAFYGPLQIKLTVTAGKVSDVEFLQYPNDRTTSIEISKQSLPILKQETIVAQSANVDIVSGATQTSEAFRVAMREVLNKAKS